ncbi:hypothetical protein MMC26_003340 [Xylographa opegraphella]|nr:hypothetical protein [Xylographa opegraphella]
MAEGFLDLPTEVRDVVYRFLLLSSRCFNADTAGRTYVMCPAILRANRVTYFEATRVLYQENDFVHVNLWGQAGTRLRGWSKRIAGLDFQLSVEACCPALTVNVGLGNLPMENSAVTSTFLIFPESLEALVERFYDYTIDGGDIDEIDLIEPLAVSLELRSKILSKRRTMQEDLLMPFRRLTGFADVEILGCVNEELRDTMQHRLTHLPSPESFAESLEHLFQRGKEAYERGRWNEARDNWLSMLKYYEYIDAITDSVFPLDSSNESLLEAFVELRPMTYWAKLGVLRVGLRLEDHSTVLRDLWECEFEDEEGMSALMTAQFHLGMVMAYHADGFVKLGREAFKDAQDIIAVEAYRYTGQVVAIMNTVSYAYKWHEDPTSQFLCAWEHCWELLNEEEVSEDEADAGSADGEEDAGGVEMADVHYEVDDFDGAGTADDGDIEWQTMVDESSNPLSEATTRYDEYDLGARMNANVEAHTVHAREVDEQSFVDW